MVERYAGDAPPDAPKRPWIVRVTTSEQQQFCVISKNIYGQYVHWYGKRTHECKKDASRCNGCQRAWPVKWLGYLNVIDMERKIVFLELTKNACDLLCDLAPEDRNLRGLQIRVKKTKGGPKGRYLVEVLERRVSSETLPQEQDPKELLVFLWNCKNQHVNGTPPAGDEATA